jgi:hypothetical protein
MPRTARNFHNDRHAVYAGWLLAELARSGLNVVPANDANGNPTPNVKITAPNGIAYDLMVPYPDDTWRLSPTPKSPSQPVPTVPPQAP